MTLNPVDQKQLVSLQLLISMHSAACTHAHTQLASCAGSWSEGAPMHSSAPCTLQDQPCHVAEVP